MPNKEVIVSIQPRWCERIANGIKTIEVRKTAPRLGETFKGYIYCTKSPNEILALPCSGIPEYELLSKSPSNRKIGNSFIIGTFTCNTIEKYVAVRDNVNDKIEYKRAEGDTYVSTIDLSKLCLTQEQLKAYGGGRDLYGWHISNLTLYNEPKTIDFLGLRRPPQSWMYLYE